MLTRVIIQNFKAFGAPASEFKLSPLTILVGPNASGKTAVLESLGLLSQTAAERSNQGGFKWRGQWVDFEPTGKAALHNGSPDLEILFGISFNNSSSGSIADLLPSKASDIEYTVLHLPRANRWLHTCVLQGEAKAIASFETGPNKRPLLTFENAGIPGIYSPGIGLGQVLSPQIFQLGGVLQSQGIGYPDAQARSQRFLEAMSTLTDFMRDRVYLIGPSRAPRKEEQNLRKYDLSVGRCGEDTLNLLSYVFAAPEHDEAAQKIQHWANAFGLGRLKAGWARRQELQAGFTDPLTQTPLSLEYSGFGSQQILPIITQIFAAPKGSLVLIEEPEISLHPGAQIELIRLFGDAVRHGRQLIVTTHSQIVPLALAELEQFSLKPEDVTIYHLTRKEDSVAVQSLHVNEKWNVPGWIPSFSAVDSKLLQNWISKVHDDIQG